MHQGNGTGRREFLKKFLSGAAFLHAGGRMALAATPEQGAAPAKSRVVLARDLMLRSNGNAPDPRRVSDLLDRSMQALFQLDSPIAPWKKLVRSGDRVGLKVNTLGGKGLSTHLTLVLAICERLQQAGVRAGDITVWDRDTREMEHAGFQVSTAADRVQCYGTDSVGYEDDLVEYGSVGSRLSRILTQRCNLLINVPVLKDHDGAGVTIALKNMYGVIHNPNKFHPNGCDPYIADLNMLPEIRSKMRLTICDAMTAQYEGGPGYKPQYTWPYNGLLVAGDPVALDYTGWQIIEHERAEMGMKTLAADGRAPRYIATAADEQHRLGVDVPGKITLLEV
jgi:uncharacterized protein (DUF362 family)